MKKMCPSCGTIVTVEAGAMPVCSNCGYGSPGGVRVAGPSSDGQSKPKVVDGAALAAKLQDFDWRKLMFMGPVLAFMSEGRLFARATAIAMRVVAAAAVIGGLVASVPLWVGATQFFYQVADWIVGIIAILVLQVLVVISTYAVAHLLVLRAGDVARLPEAQFTITPLASVLLRVAGKIAALMAFPVGVAVGFFGAAAAAGAAAGLGGALLGLLIAAPIAALALVFFHFLAEAVIVVVETAKNTAAMRGRVRLEESFSLQEATA